MNRQKEYWSETVIERCDLFKKRCRDIHGNLYSYININYINDRTPIKLKCKKHGIFYMQPRHHLRGQVCAKCRNEERGINLRGDTKTFIKRAIDKYNDKFDYSKSVYIKLDGEIDIICREHGIFRTTPRKHLDNRKGNSGSCPGCRKSGGFNGDKEAVLYLFRLLDSDIFKIGITNRTLEARYTKTLVQEYFRNIQLVPFKKGSTARDVETKLKAKLIKWSHKGSDLLPDGNTEVYNGKVAYLIARKVLREASKQN